MTENDLRLESLKLTALRDYETKEDTHLYECWQALLDIDVSSWQDLVSNQSLNVLIAPITRQRMELLHIGKPTTDWKLCFDWTNERAEGETLDGNTNKEGQSLSEYMQNLLGGILYLGLERYGFRKLDEESVCQEFKIFIQKHVYIYIYIYICILFFVS